MGAFSQKLSIAPGGGGKTTNWIQDRWECKNGTFLSKIPNLDDISMPITVKFFTRERNYASINPTKIRENCQVYSFVVIFIGKIPNFVGFGVEGQNSCTY